MAARSTVATASPYTPDTAALVRPPKATRFVRGAATTAFGMVVPVGAGVVGAGTTGAASTIGASVGWSGVSTGADVAGGAGGAVVGAAALVVVVDARVVVVVVGGRRVVVVRMPGTCALAGGG